MTEQNYTTEWLPAGSIEIDHSVQRTALDQNKIERFKKKFNPAALGIITVSRRNAVTNVAVDGMHRTRVVVELFGPDEKILCHVFHGLTRAEEAQMFLDLNAGTQPSLLDKFKVRLTAEDPIAVEIDKLTKAYGWTIQGGVAKGVIQAVGALERIYRKSLKIDAEPNLLLVSVMCATHAWGNDPLGVQATILEGIAAVAEEYGSVMDLEILQRKLRNYAGGPAGLHTDAVQMASIRKGRVTMGVAERLVDEYNKGRQKKTLHTWRRRA